MARSHRRTPACVELFAGGGGAASGLRAAGFHSLACVEADRNACATLRAAGFPAVQAWIGPGAPEGLPVFDPAPYVEVDLLWASPPCQPFSRAGKRLGTGDARDGWPATLATVLAIRPRWVVIENVVGSPVEAWAGALRTLYPWAEVWRMDAADYGLPSHRQRVYLIAGPRPVTMPRPTHYGPGVPWLLRAERRPWVSIGKALPHLAGGGMTITPGNGGNLPAPRPLDQTGHTVTGCCPLYLSGSSDERRRLTPQECATLVGFPVGYPIQGTKEARYMQIGNAVAPIMAEVIGRAILAEM